MFVNKYKSISALKNKLCLDFDGVAHHVAGSLDVVLDYEIFISAWINITADSDVKTIIDARDADNDGIFFFVNADEKLCVSEGSSDVVSSNAIPVGKWVHVAFMNGGASSSDERHLFINGLEDGSSTDSITNNISTKYYTIGATNTQAYSDGGNQSGFFNGQISELTIYKGTSDKTLAKKVAMAESFNHLNWKHNDKLKLWLRFGDAEGDIVRTETKIETGILYDSSTSTVGSLDKKARDTAFGPELYTTSNASALKNYADATTGWSSAYSGSGSGGAAITFSTTSYGHHGAKALKLLMNHGSLSPTTASGYTSVSCQSGKSYMLSMKLLDANHTQYGHQYEKYTLIICSGEPTDDVDGGMTGIVYNQGVKVSGGGVIWGSSEGTLMNYETSGDYRQVDIPFIANASTMYINFFANGSYCQGQWIVIDGVSVREIPGFHATIKGISSSDSKFTLSRDKNKN